MTVQLLTPVRDRALLEESDFDPVEAMRAGVMGLRKPTVTLSAIEAFACCHGYVAPA